MRACEPEKGKCCTTQMSDEGGALILHSRLYTPGKRASTPVGHQRTDQRFTWRQSSAGSTIAARHLTSESPFPANLPGHTSLAPADLEPQEGHLSTVSAAPFFLGPVAFGGLRGSTCTDTGPEGVHVGFNLIWTGLLHDNEFFDGGSESTEFSESDEGKQLAATLAQDRVCQSPVATGEHTMPSAPTTPNSQPQAHDLSTRNPGSCCSPGCTAQDAETTSRTGPPTSNKLRPQHLGTGRVGVSWTLNCKSQETTPEAPSAAAAMVAVPCQGMEQTPAHALQRAAVATAAKCVSMSGLGHCGGVGDICIHVGNDIRCTCTRRCASKSNLHFEPYTFPMSRNFHFSDGGRIHVPVDTSL
jgi:hypothetical protein